MDPAGPGRRPTLRAPKVTLDQLWLWLFVGLVAAALPLLLFRYGAYHWFLRDDWHFLADRSDSALPYLLEPHGGSHWVAVPRLIYLVLWEAFGLTSYRPYQAVMVVMHLAVAVLLRVVMRRAGVRPLLASAAAAVFVLCGPGAVNTMWAFQVTFIGSLAWGLGHLLLADHDGPLDRRDLVGLGLGVLAIASSAVGISTAVAVGVAVLLRRGWRPALVHTVPLAVIYLAWAAIADARTGAPAGRPTLGVLLTWMRDTFASTYVGLARFEAGAWVLAGVLLVGLVLVAGEWRGAADARAVRTRLALPLGLAAAAVFFAATTGSARWRWPGGAQTDRYVYLQAAFLLPLLAVAAEAVAQRWRVLVVPLALLLLLPIPFNLGGFEEGVFGPAYMRNRERILTTAVRMPFAGDVPRDVQPAPEAYSSDGVTIGFLLAAERDGRLEPSTEPLTPAVINEFKVRLGVAQRRVPGPPTGCRSVPSPLDIDPAQGEVLLLDSRVAISTRDGDRATSPAVPFPLNNGNELTFELPDLHLRISSPSTDTIRLCDADGGTGAG